MAILFSRSQGCYVWDIDGAKFTDMSIMGVGTNILGYCNPSVDSEVINALSKGNLTTLNCYEEVLLAEKLVDLHPWSDNVRFARTGGEANAIAIRLARAATGKTDIALCGYHGWHDWYLATNLQSIDGLDQHLLPGLDPLGVPKELSGTVSSFKYNDLDGLKEIILNRDLAAVIMEVERGIPPLPGFLESVRDLCTKSGIVLIFDECTSGFRTCLGGHHLTKGVFPDLAMFGKALGNGYAITAIVGHESVMSSCTRSFISSTFWTERIGNVAGLATLAEMERLHSWEHICEIGRYIKSRLNVLANAEGIQLNLSGLDPLISLQFPYRNALAYKTLITQEMLKKGWLASTSIYVCISHTKSLIDEYLESMQPIFKSIRDCEDGADIDQLLETSICSAHFGRIN